MMAPVGHTPLTGTRVIDVTTSIAGPYCAQILAALGADVVKVERPDTGDDGRAWGPPFWNGEGTMFLSANAGKRSLAVSLRDPRGREVLHRLVDDADVFLQSLRPGLADELGLGPESLQERNPQLVYCSVGAYGHVGPLSREPGYDALMQAAGGLISMTGEPGRPGVRVGSSLIDQGTGTWAALGVLAALLERDRTGEGSVVDVSLYETALGYIGYHLAGYLADGTVPAGTRHALPDGGAVPGVPHARRRADDRRRQRPPVRRDLCRPRPPGARRRPALPQQPRPGRQPRRAVRDPRGAARASATRPTGRPGSRRQACRRLPSPTSQTSPALRRPRHSECCNRSTIRPSPTSGSRPCRSRSTASGRCTAPRHPPSVSTQRRYCVRPATRPRRSRHSPQKE